MGSLLLCGSIGTVALMVSGAAGIGNLLVIGVAGWLLLCFSNKL